MIQSATPFIKGIDEYLKLEPEHPELAERIGRCLHKMGKLPYPEPDKPPARPLHRRGASEEQKHAIETALTAPLSYITAGPGSGKTSMVLVSAAVSLLRAGRRVMITAFTNSAVEHALSSVLAALGEEAKAYAPMRLGRSSEGFSTRWGELCTNTGEEPQLVGITLDLLAKALSEGTLGFEPDHILIDEAAYAPLVKVLPLLTYRKSRITMLGDHHQLPPVCDPKVQRCRGNRSLWLWQHSAVELGAIFDEPIWRPGRLRITNTSVAALTRSYRFGTELADVLSRRLYGDKLVGAAAHGTSIEVLPALGHTGRARCSPAEADAIGGLVPTLTGSDYAVLTPYHAQERLLTEMMPQNERGRIHTIHSTQGREWDTVVLSVVDGEKPLLMDSQNRAVHGLEVLNTAVSRAKKRLIIVCDTASWQGRSGQLLSDLIEIGKWEYGIPG